MKRDCILRPRLALVCGLLGCLCYGAGDWLMIYGDPACTGTLSWLTAGGARIPLWRYDLAMALAFPGILLYGIALFSAEGFIGDKRKQRACHWMNAFGMTPWIALHLFYVMILTLFSWMHGHGYASDALRVCEGLYSSLSWIIPASEAMMLPVFLYWLWLLLRRETVFPRWMACFHVLPVLAVLKGVTLLLPVSAFRLGLTNGLMSESMLFWFGSMLWWECRGKGG